MKMVQGFDGLLPIWMDMRGNSWSTSLWVCPTIKKDNLTCSNKQVEHVNYFFLKEDMKIVCLIFHTICHDFIDIIRYTITMTILFIN